MTLIDKKLQKLSQNGTVRITTSCNFRNGFSLTFYDYKGDRYQLGDKDLDRLLKQAEIVAFDSK